MKKVYKEILSWILLLSIAIGLALFINKVVIYRVEPISASMEDTILVGEKVVTFRLSYLFKKPQRGDIVVFKFPDNEYEDYIKRVIGRPGEVIEGKDGVVYIDGEPIEEDYIMDQLDSDFGPLKVPEDEYFMMGDNRSISFDSRLWDNQFVHKDKIYGKAIFKYPDFKWLY